MQFRKGNTTPEPYFFTAFLIDRILEEEEVKFERNKILTNLFT